MGIDVLTIKTLPVEGQKPGTSGLRKKVKLFEQGNYLPNFIQATFDALDPEDLKGCTIVMGGDGRYFNKVALSVMIKMAAANGVGKVLVAQDGVLCTPAASAVIRKHGALGGFILSASHNPAGPDDDWGIKYNGRNGGPAPESVTNAIFENTSKICQYKIAAHFTWPGIDLSKLGTTSIGPGFEVEVIDSVTDYFECLEPLFDIEAIRALFANPKFSFKFDAMHAASGPYARRILGEQLGAKTEDLLRCDVLEDFGGLHPDPNLKYAKDLVDIMMVFAEDPTGAPIMGAASDGDADRNMILGGGFFVSPSDSLAVIAANASCIKSFAAGGLKGLARSMPTSGAVDKVAAALGVECFEVPTGWKFFGNLMDADRCSICGEESFGTGSDHVREKDGMWAVLAWLSILAAKNVDRTPEEDIVTVKEIVREHWRKYGRNYYTRWDYEGVESHKADELMEGLRKALPSLPGSVLGDSGLTVATADEFSYTDPIDNSVTERQGIRIMAADGTRVVFRLSGTGSSGATIRLYVEKYTAPPGEGGAPEPEDGAEAAPAEAEADTGEYPADLELPVEEALGDLVAYALKVSRLVELTGCEEPTVKT